MVCGHISIPDHLGIKCGAGTAKIVLLYYVVDYLLLLKESCESCGLEQGQKLHGRKKVGMGKPHQFLYLESYVTSGSADVKLNKMAPVVLTKSLSGKRSTVSCKECRWSSILLFDTSVDCTLLVVTCDCLYSLSLYKSNTNT